MQFSYSAPICVSVADAARATTAPPRVDTLRFVAARPVCVALRFVVLFLDTATRDVDFGVSVVRTRCVGVPFRMDVDATVVVRDAANPPDAKNVQKTKINPILFISDINVSKF